MLALVFQCHFKVKFHFTTERGLIRDQTVWCDSLCTASLNLLPHRKLGALGDGACEPGRALVLKSRITQAIAAPEQSSCIKRSTQRCYLFHTSAFYDCILLFSAFSGFPLVLYIKIILKLPPSYHFCRYNYLKHLYPSKCI